MKLNHKNIVRLEIAKLTKKHIYMIMEYCDSTLMTLLKQKNLKEKDVLYLFKDVINGFRYLVNEKNMIHRDIKPENILVENNIIKLADFGFGREML